MELVYGVVVTYNGIKWVDRCFGSLRDSSHPLKIIAVDNGSTDGTQEEIRRKFPEVELIQSPTNLGFGKGNNVGIKQALAFDTDFVFLLNQDAWVEPETIATLIEAANNNKTYGILSPVHLQDGKEHLDPQFSFYVAPPKCPGFLDDLFMKRTKDVYSCKFINAAAWLMTQDCLRKIGLFEPMFQLYGEDDNYIQRMRYYGLNIGLVPRAFIVHDRAERKGKKNEYGQKLEIRNYILIRMLNLNESLTKNFFRSFNVFLQYGVNYKTMTIFLSVMLKLTSIRKRRWLSKNEGYML